MATVRPNWKGTVTSAAITAAGTSDTVAEIGIMEGATKLWATCTAGDKKIDDFDIFLRSHSDAGYLNMGANLASDFIALEPRWPILRCTTNPKLLDSDAPVMLTLAVKGLYAVKLTASASDAATTVTTYWQQR